MSSYTDPELDRPEAPPRIRTQLGVSLKMHISCLGPGRSLTQTETSPFALSVGGTNPETPGELFRWWLGVGARLWRGMELGRLGLPATCIAGMLWRFIALTGGVSVPELLLVLLMCMRLGVMVALSERRTDCLTVGDLHVFVSLLTLVPAPPSLELPPEFSPSLAGKKEPVDGCHSSPSSSRAPAPGEKRAPEDAAPARSPGMARGAS
mmetsp:Transcript_35533/g.99826  ORF Transcript_35533/g.99826 Transcript_35533/m.99826 type:complete len:208 (-) Transcript_35533:143-766(-)